MNAFFRNSIFLLIISIFFIRSFKTFAVDSPIIFPFPQEIQITCDTFYVDNKVLILIPENASDSEIRLSNLLAGELCDRYGLALPVKVASYIPKNQKVIIIGSKNNDLVKKYCDEFGICLNENKLGKEGYFLQVKDNIVVVGGLYDAGTFYGFQSLRQLFMANNGKFLLGLSVMDWPIFSFRGIKLYVPGPENIAFFKRFIKDFMALYKFNKVILEITCMRLDRHPEVNAGWIDFAHYLKNMRLNSTEGPKGELKTSTHYDVGDGQILEKEDVRDIIDFARENCVEVIPEIPSLSHCYYLLTRHPELAEYPDDQWPDTYCPSNPSSYELMFDIYDEYIEVMQPRMVHIGHDEWYGAPWGICPRCSMKDYSEVYAMDVRKIHDFFAKKNIRIAMWGDYLLEEVRGKGLQDRVSSRGIKYKVPGAINPDMVQLYIPKDILIFNWFWGKKELDQKISQFGFEQVYGNFKPNISNWADRGKIHGILGGAPSSWAATNEINIGKDLLLDFMGCANLLWSSHQVDPKDLGNIMRSSLVAQIRNSLKGESYTNKSQKSIIPLNISSFYNLHPGDSLFNFKPDKLDYGEISVKDITFDIGHSLVGIRTGENGSQIFPSEVTKIGVNRDVSSIIFLHACALPGMNKKSYYNIPSFLDTSDLLGWYEIIYEDDLKDIIPIRYGINILEWNPGGEKSIDRGEGTTGALQNAYCYEADPVICSRDKGENSVYFFEYEWVNRRLGKKIKEINLKGTCGFYRSAGYLKAEGGPLAPPNAIFLGAINLVIPLNSTHN